MPLRRLLLLVLALAVGGCDRPFVEERPPDLEVLAPDLTEVRLDDRLALALRASSFRGIERVEVNGSETTYDAQADVYLDTLTLGEGLTAIRVDAFDTEGVVGTDTLYALYLPYRVAALGLFALPAPVAFHTATTLANAQRVLVAGGVGPLDQPTNAASLVTEGSSYTVAPTGALATARLGHTATRLPDGRVLVLGGATQTNPEELSALVNTAELYDPGPGTFTTLPYRGVPIRRAFHTADLVVESGRTFVVAYGGRGFVDRTDGRTGTRGDVQAFEFRQSAAGDSLVALLPDGAGVFTPLAGHALIALDERRSLVAGTYTDPIAPAVPDPVAFRFLYPTRTTPATLPFEIQGEFVGTMRADRTEHAGALLQPGFAFVAGGRTVEGAVLASMEAYADAIGQFFRYPPSVSLFTERRGLTATRMPSGRILLLGGLDGAGAPRATAELVLDSD